MADNENKISKVDLPNAPNGDPQQQRGKGYYNRLYAKDAESYNTNKLVGYARPWYRHSGRVVWHPALLLAKPPILDLGCGAGHLAAMCKSYDIPYYAGIDYSPPAIRLAHIHTPGTKFLTGDVFGESATILLRDVGRYQTVCILELLEHIVDDLGLIARVPQGKIIVGAVPDFPTDGHVRWFGFEDAVIERYSSLLDIDRCIVEHAIAQSSNRWFIFRGVRK